MITSHCPKCDLPVHREVAGSGTCPVCGTALVRDPAWKRVEKGVRLMAGGLAWSAIISALSFFPICGMVITFPDMGRWLCVLGLAVPSILACVITHFVGAFLCLAAPVPRVKTWVMTYLLT